MMPQPVRFALSLCGMASALVILNASAQDPPKPTPVVTPPAVLKIDYPEAGGLLVGPGTLAIHMDPDTIVPERVDFFVDGVSVCRLTAPPFECRYDAGTRMAEHLVRVTAVLSDGTRLVESVKTAKIDLTETTGTRSVLVPVVVTDKRGKPVQNLKRGDFRLFDNGVPQEITLFESENVRLDVSVALDISGSMTKSLEHVKQAVGRFVSSFKPADHITLLAFNDRVFVVSRDTETSEQRLEALGRIEALGGTAIYDAIVKGLDLLGTEISRRALVVFSDGRDMHSLLSARQVEARLKTSDAAVYVVVSGKTSDMKETLGVLERVAAASGGRIYSIADVKKDLTGVLTEIYQDVAEHYLLAFAPSGAIDGNVHQITVTVPGQADLTVRARGGYTAAKTP